MTIHTVTRGQCLWNIVKEKFQLTSNTDIANKVNEIAKKNNLLTEDQRNTIQIGQKIDLGDDDTGLVVESSEEESIEDQYTALTQAQKAAQTKIDSLNNATTEEGQLAAADLTVNLFDKETATDEDKTKAYMEYADYLLKNYFDKNGDGVVTTDEFSEKETKDEMLTYSLGNTEVNTQALTNTNNLFAHNIDVNGNGIIEANELAFMTTFADKAGDGTKDGIISAFDNSIAKFDFTIDKRAASEGFVEKYSEVIEKYKAGETLTAAEKQLLNEGITTYHNGIQNAFASSPFAKKTN